MANTVLGNAMNFLVELGVFEIILPFLLVFTMVFAFLEKTKIYGTEEYRSENDGKIHQVTRKNLNSMTAFVIAFFVVASAQLVSLISEVTSKVVLLIVLVFSFTLTIGAFQKQEKDGFFLNKTWTIIFEVIVFIGIALIFLNSLGWLDKIYAYLQSNWSGEILATVLMMAIFIGFIWYITKDPNPKQEKKKD
ncbi:hypothetical protein KO361_03655 [Candidatus Woesearchaeota archaeon]|nr:hypothetical protein [Candidatus Woesearchaeota archaeon]